MSGALVVDPRHPDLPSRQGPPPVTTRPSAHNPFPHQQVTQTAPVELQERLFRRAASLPGVTVQDSCVSVPGARAFHLDEEMVGGPEGAFQCAREFAHIHPAGDGSLHLALPAGVREEARGKGWGEPHPISGTLLLFGPRDEVDLETVWQLLLVSYRYALGDLGADV